MADDKNEYAWEKEYERSWEALQEDETGALRLFEQQDQRETKRRRQESQQVIHRGMIRYLCIVLDLSVSMLDTDLRPNRLAVVMRLVEEFIREYFDQNPLSHVSIVVTRESRTEVLTNLSGSPNKHIKVIKKLSASGNASFQSAWFAAYLTLRSIPSYGTRELLFIHSALSTTDSEDINETIAALKKSKVRCSAISLSAEVFICKKLSRETLGTFGVALTENHFKQLLHTHITPPPAFIEVANKLYSAMIPMGFPKQNSANTMVCLCHEDIRPGGIICPRCRSKSCDLPTKCKVCGLTLVSSAHLARSYHHLFPIPLFQELQGVNRRVCCFGCKKQVDMTTSICLVCPKCDQRFCFDCDSFIHDSLHNCPGCQQLRIEVEAQMRTS